MTDFLNCLGASMMGASAHGAAPGGSVIEMTSHDVEDSGMDSLLSRPDDRPPDAEEILRRLRDQLLESHRRKIFRTASGDAAPKDTH
jgi:hypothetical protein